MDFITFFFTAFFNKVPVVAGIIILLIILSTLSFYQSWKSKKLNSFSSHAPTILTTAGLLGTFVGLSIGLKGLNFHNNNLDIASFSLLIENLKAVFIYALSGIFSSLIFMMLNTIILRVQNIEAQVQNKILKHNAKTYNEKLLDQQDAQIQHLQQMASSNKQSLESQKMMQADIAKLQFDNDNQELAHLISQGVVKGLAPLLLEIKSAVADQGADAIKQVLEDLKTEILVPMNGALGRTNDALESTNQAVKATIDAIKESQEHNDKLIQAVGDASDKMQIASEKMNGLVDKIDGTVQHMDDIQVAQKASLDGFNQELKANLAHIPTAIQIGMQAAQDGLVAAINETSTAMQRDVKQVLVDTTVELKDTIGEATTGMKDASLEMQKLVTSIDDTVQHMDDIQIAQKASLDGFNQELQTNLATIEPSIREGLDHAKGALTTAIGGAAVLMTTSIDQASQNMQDNIKVASNEMVTNIRTTLTGAGTELKGAVHIATTELNQSVTATIEKQNESINASFNKFDDAQGKLNTILTTFSTDMNDHLDRMATELEEVGTNAEKMINTAASNLEKTLGEIDTKLLNTAKVLEVSLEAFRVQYQESLTTYLEQQTENLDGFLDRQNEQLERTIGEQRKGLVEVTQSLTEQFNFMDEKQKEINSAHTQLIKVINGAGLSILPKVESIARELNQGEQKLSHELALSSKNLDGVSTALQSLGKDLPPAFESAFKQLDQNYKEAFEDLDRGLKDAVNRLGSTVGALAQAIHLHDAMTQ